MGPERRYRLLRILEQGEIVELHEAVRSEQGIELRVAIKRLLPHLAQDPESVEAFIDESRILSRIRHANIASIFDFGMMDGAPFQACELIDGVDLAALAALAVETEGRFPLEVALHVSAEVAHALGFLHGATDATGPLEIVHRDISPENILVSWAGEVKVIDFGIALARQRKHATQTGIAKGKIDFMAPEQIRGEAIDGRTDIYALGCLLQWMVTGKPPRREPNALMPEDVVRIVRRATDPKKEARFPTGIAFARDCGSSLVERIDTDGRSVLCEWLQRVRPPVEPKAGRLDDLFGVALDAGERDDARKTVSVLHPASATIVSRTDRSARPSARSAWAILALGLSGLTAGALYLAAPPEPELRVATERPAIAPVVAVARPEEEERDAPPAKASSDAVTRTKLRARKLPREGAKPDPAPLASSQLRVELDELERILQDTRQLNLDRLRTIARRARAVAPELDPVHRTAVERAADEALRCIESCPTAEERLAAAREAVMSLARVGR